ncbi:Type 1 glutamine amidotransferase-like domain-containing protein [Nonomuraea sp. NPDC050310]|uniref:Type 1 glutamine amidotransferase-like domain-containing protein n=1 Tax=Nonomuraea sp. NPDC050310 TaxID=3154935 RepID=UPI0033E14C6E
MRMYLSSFRMGEHPEALLDLLDGRASGEVAVIANAMDAQPPAERVAGVEREVTALAALGLRAVELDLRDFFDRPGRAVAAELARFPVVWVRGGNVFMLRYALARSGADAALTALIRADALVYAGYSAGPCVLAPSLRGLEACDDAEVVPAAYGEPVVWAGLGILDFAFVPHVDSPGHPESAALNAVAAAYRRDGVPHRTLRDGQALVVRGTEMSLI